MGHNVAMASSTKTLLSIASFVLPVEGPNYIKIKYFADTFQTKMQVVANTNHITAIHQDRKQITKC